MIKKSHSSLLSLYKSVSDKSSLVVFVVGCLVLIGWVVDIQFLKSLHSQSLIMKVSTAVSFILAGISLWLLQERRAAEWMRRIAQVCAALAALTGLLALCEYLLGIDLIGIDHLFFDEAPVAIGTDAPGRMGFNTALNFLLIGLSLFILGFERRTPYILSQYLAIAAALLALFIFVGYLFNIESLLGSTSYINMSLPAALAFIVICVGILCARPDAGFMTIVTSEGVGGVLARRLIFPAIGIPLFIAWLRLLGQEAGFYGTEFGVALYAMSNIAIFALLILWTARLLDRIDVERKAFKEERDSFFTLSIDMFCIAGFDGYFKQLNPVWEKTIGWETEELLSRPYIEFIHPEDKGSTSGEAQRLSSGESVITFENRYLCKDGSYKWLQWNSYPSVESRLIYGMARDITGRKKMEEQVKKLNKDLESRAHQLEAANKELEAFSYSVSHDLRAPLRSIDGFSQALLEDYADKFNEQGRDYLHRVRAATQKMAQLIDDMLKLSRVTRAELIREEVDLSVLVEGVAAELLRTQSGREVEFAVASGLRAQGDQKLLRIAVENLINNAWKFTGKKSGARIEFGITQYNSEEAYFVRDNGVGFDMAYAGKLFGAFQRLHDSCDFPGTGIGLATVQRVIHKHGGKVWAEGEMGKGAAFYFTLPKAA